MHLVEGRLGQHTLKQGCDDFISCPIGSKTSCTPLFLGLEEGSTAWDTPVKNNRKSEFTEYKGRYQTTSYYKGLPYS